VSSSAIASMYKYRVQRFWTELSQITQQKSIPESNLTVSDLINLDQYHYLGIEAVDIAAQKLGISAQSHVLDIGSGIGGTARYLAWKYGCKAIGVELQEQLHTVGIEMTDATGMQDRVKLMVGDFTDISGLGIPDRSFDSWVSLMVFLHICDRTTLLQNCARVLKPQGKFYIEDYYAAKVLTPSEQNALAEIIACPYLPSREQYIQDLEQAGFTSIEFIDVSHLWQPWLQARFDQFELNRSHYESLFDLDLVNSYSHFYQTVAGLFSSGNLGGVRICGTRN
jgi:cyclopropane fatty-acyl-phospholipid synthase-like methyltransferase